MDCFMKKLILLMSVFSMLLLTSCGGEKKVVYTENMEADGFAVKGAATATPVPTLAPEERDFRGMKWGMTLSDVTNNEGEGYRTVKEGVIRYNDLTVAGFPVESEYTFENGKLSTCIYYTTHKHSKTEDYIKDYDLMKERYLKKYGTPLYSEAKWGTGNRDGISEAEGLEKGLMMYRTGWEIGNTRINLVLFKDTDSKVKIGIRYQAIDINGSGDVAPEGDIEI